MTHISDVIVDTIEDMKSNNRYKEALAYVNELMIKDPSNQELLLQVADIQYRMGAIDKATKAVDYLNDTSDNQDPLGLYVKGVLEMEKNNRVSARSYLRDAIGCIDHENTEIMRCYALSEYRYGNREKGLQLLVQAYQGDTTDAETLCNLVELYLIEKKFAKARTLLTYFVKHKDRMNYFDKDASHYTTKISIYDEYVRMLQKPFVTPGV